MMRQVPSSDYTGQLEAAARFIREHDHFLVIAHVFPDGDAFGSTFAMGFLLQALGKSFLLVNEDKLPEKYYYLSEELGISRTSSVTEIPNQVICLDCADFSRLGSITERLKQTTNILNIDHHPTNDYYGNVQLIRIDAAATAEILYDLVEHMKVPWTQPLATAVYTGILTDTGGFRYANTTPAVLVKASHLLQFGVKANELSYELLEKRSYAHFELLKRSLQTLTMDADKRICWMVVSEHDIVETGATMEDLDGLINYPRNVAGVEVGILFKQIDPNTVKVSLRSIDPINVSDIASSLGGGGHKNAAGVTLHTSLEEAVTKVLAEIKKKL